MADEGDLPPPEEEGEGEDDGEGEGETEDAEAGEEEDERFSIKRVIIKPGKSIAEARDISYPNRLPAIPKHPKAYTPMPYVFRIPSGATPAKISNLLARTPPFHLLLDHTIAVIWLIFGQGEYDSPLGINQLQWALSFLKTIQDRNGDYSEDIELCIDAIENILLGSYADLHEEINNATRLDDTVHYGGGALATGGLIMQEIPFSINYLDMISKCPPSVYIPGQVQPMSMTSLECEEALEEIKKAAGVDSIENLDSVSRDKAINVLRMWKSDQVQKIRGELRRLRSIEDKMRDIDVNFPGYMEDEPEALIRSD